MTSIVGVLCSDGAVIGTDSVATFGDSHFRTIEQQTEKLSVIGDVIVAGTGSVGLSQRFCAIVDSAYHQQKIFARNSPIEVVKTLSRAGIEDMHQTYLKPGLLGALVAFPCNNAPQLCEFPGSDFQPELKDKRLWYVSMGNAQPITDPFLGFIRSVFWESGLPSVSDAIFAVTWTLQHAIDLNVGGVNGPIKLAVLEKDNGGKYRARMVDSEELDEYHQHIRDAYAALREFKTREKTGNIPTPDIPKP